MANELVRGAQLSHHEAQASASLAMAGRAWLERHQQSRAAEFFAASIAIHGTARGEQATPQILTSVALVVGLVETVLESSQRDKFYVRLIERFEHHRRGLGRTVKPILDRIVEDWRQRAHDVSITSERVDIPKIG